MEHGPCVEECLLHLPINGGQPRCRIGRALLGRKGQPARCTMTPDSLRNVGELCTLEAHRRNVREPSIEDLDDADRVQHTFALEV